MPHRSVLFLWCNIAFIVAIGIGTYWTIDQQIITICAAVGATLCVLFFRTRLLVVGLCVLFASLAFWRISFMPTYETPNEAWESFEAVVVQEPELFADSQRIVVASTAIEGKIQISASLHPRWYVGDVLQMSCRLQKPKPFDSFAYDKYLERFYISALCYYPKIAFVGHRQFFQERLYAFKQYAMSRFQKTIAPPENMMIVGALFGNKRALPDDINEFFKRTGTSHVIVISGLHIVMLIVIMSKILQIFGCSKSVQSIGSIVLIFLYIAITGFQSSAVRAALFGGITLLAYLLGRKHSSLRVLLFAAALMLAANPLMLWYDVGFQLSFAATAGILLLNTRIEEKLFFLPQTWRPLLSITIASMITTAPIIVYHFHTFAPIGLFANILLVPMMTLIMVAGLVVIGVALCSITAAQVLALPLYYCIHLFIAIAQWFASFSWATLYI